MTPPPIDSETGAATSRVDTPTQEHLSHAEWWNSTQPPVADIEGSRGAPPVALYTDAHAAASLRRAGGLVVLLCVLGLPLAFWFGGWRAALALLVGAAISGSGLWEWRRLMAALTARMDAAEVVQARTGAVMAKAPSIGFAIAGFTVRLLVVLVVLYGSLSYLRGSAASLAAGLAMGVVALTVEAVRSVRAGTT